MVIEPNPSERARACVCESWLLGTGRLRFALNGAGPAPSDEATDRAWEGMAATNPRLFDGLFLSVERWTPDRSAGGVAGGGGEFGCRVERYRRLATAGVVRCGCEVRLLALTGVVTARDSAGAEHVLMGLRAAQTRMYGGLWEFAPAGGVDPPGAGQLFDVGLLRRVLARELEEEVGLAPESMGACEPVMVVLNSEARSYDVVMRARLLIGVEEAALRARPGSWEYERVEWVPVEEARGFAEVEGMVPQGLEILRRLGW